MSALDRDVDALGIEASTTSALWQLADLVVHNEHLADELVKPALTAEQRAELVHALFDSRVGTRAAEVLATVVRHVSDPNDVAPAMIRQSVRATFAASSDIDQVQNELFRFARIVAADVQLDAAIRNQLTPVSDRRSLVRSLLSDKANPATIELAERAVHDGRPPYVDTLDAWVQIAAEIKNHKVARVTVAIAPDADQLERLSYQLTRIYGRGIDIEIVVDPDVMGGVIVDVDDERIDGSIRRKVDDIRRSVG